MASTQHLPPAYTSPTKPVDSPRKTLHRHAFTFVFAILFLFLVITPWVFLNVLNVRPIGGKYSVSSWQDVSGWMAEDAVQTSAQLYRASGVLYTLTAVLTFPILSMVLNHAAVVFVQRRHPDQPLDASQMLSLADAPWSRLPSLRIFDAPRSAFAYGAMALVALGFTQLILQSALVTWEEVRVATFLDVPLAKWQGWLYTQERHSIVGYDSYPNRIAQLPIALVTQEVAARLSTESRLGVQPRRWYEEPDTSDKFPIYGNEPPSFAAAFPNGLDTGVLRYHAMRLNTSVQCEAVSRDSFPDTCPGPVPFSGNVSLPSRDGEHDPAYGKPNIFIRWCVPGNFSSSPWTLSRDRQSIAEDLFVDVFLPDGSYSAVFRKSFTTHCSASTTRGYFELPNYHNNFKHGPLLENWTIPQEHSAIANDEEESIFDDFSLISWDYYSNYPYYNFHQVTPGPLTTAMISMLGNESWIPPLQNISETSDSSTLDTIYRDMCTGGIPLLLWYDTGSFSVGASSCSVARVLDYGYSNVDLQDIKSQVYRWFNAFEDTSSVQDTLASVAFITNEATLTRASQRSGAYSGAGVIHTSPGATARKPSISLPAQIAISVLIGVEALAILLLLAYIYRKPTFTNRLDTLMVATIGAQLSAAGVELPHLNETGANRYKHLKEHDGVIGLSHGSLTDEEARGGSTQGPTPGQPGTNSSNDIELSAMDEPQPSRILIVGGIGKI